MKWILILLLKGYKYILSPILPRACRFTPTCSEYGMQALQKYGVIKGSVLTVKRLSKCHPWGGSGYDPLP